MLPENFNIDEFIQYLQGSSNSLSSACNTFEIEEDDLTQEHYDKIDQEIFECETCGWWCEVSEMSENEDMVCKDCEN